MPFKKSHDNIIVLCLKNLVISWHILIFLASITSALWFWNLHSILSWMMYSTGLTLDVDRNYVCLWLSVCCQVERESERKQTNVFHACYISSDWQLWWQTSPWDPEHRFSILTCRHASFLSDFWFTLTQIV